MTPFSPSVALLALSVLAQPAGADVATPDLVKQSVQRSVPMLMSEGIKWARERQCSSCHQVPFMIWSLNEAQRRGISLSRDELKQWTDWELTYGSYKGVFYQIKDPFIPVLQKAGIPADKAAELKKVKNLFVNDKEFRAALGKVLSPELLGKHEAQIMKMAAQPNQGGKGAGNDDMVPSEMLLFGVPATSSAPADVSKTLVERVVKMQAKNGSWKHAGQFDGQNRPAKESTEINTIWNVLGLISYEPRSDLAGKSLEKAYAFLKDAKPGVSTESYVVHTLLAHRRGETARANELVKELFQQQLPDGGWSWLKGNSKSDAFATGEVLYVLGVLGRSHTDPSVQKAWSFLLKTQRPDGTWVVPSAAAKKKGKASADPIYSYWGTGWAVVGLLRTLPQ